VVLRQLLLGGLHQKPLARRLGVWRQNLQGLFLCNEKYQVGLLSVACAVLQGRGIEDVTNVGGNSYEWWDKGERFIVSLDPNKVWMPPAHSPEQSSAKIFLRDLGYILDKKIKPDPIYSHTSHSLNKFLGFYLDNYLRMPKDAPDDIVMDEVNRRIAKRKAALKDTEYGLESLILKRDESYDAITGGLEQFYIAV
jgi:hypothetical protein